MISALKRSGSGWSLDSFRRAFNASDHQTERLHIYAALLEKWQGAVNLVAPDTLPIIWQRHFADSAQLLRLIEVPAKCVDFGTGAGFPGMVLAIILADRGCEMHLVESNARKCAFLRNVARETATPVEIHNARIEEILARGTVTNANVVMARGVAPLTRLIGLSEPLMAAGAAGVFPKGRRADAEVVEARKAWTFELRSHPSVTDSGGQVLEIWSPRRVKGRT